jgi:hypothetical protein
MRLFLGAELGQTVDDRAEISAAVAKKIFDPARPQDFQISLAYGFHRNCYRFIPIHDVAPRPVNETISSAYFDESLQKLIINRTMLVHDHEPIRAIEETKNGPDLLPRQYHWQPLRPFGPDNTVADLLTQNLAAEKSDSI